MRNRTFHIMCTITLVVGLLFVTSGVTASPTSITTYVWAPTDGNNANNASNWYWQTDTSYGYGKIPLDTPYTNVQFLSGDVDCEWDIPDTFGNFYLGESYTGDVILNNNLTVRSLTVENGRFLVDNYSLFVTGYDDQNIIVWIFTPENNIDIGLIIIILACGMIFVGFIFRRIKNLDGN